MPEPTKRIVRRAVALFGDRAGEAVDLLREVESERVQASALVISRGDWGRFEQALRLIEVDWRDALVGAGLADEDWPLRLDEVLGPL